MNEEQLLYKLSERARQERPPQVDVSDRVMAILRHWDAEEIKAIRPLAWLAAFSSATAALAAMIVFQSLQVWTDPLIGIFFDLQ